MKRLANLRPVWCRGAGKTEEAVIFLHLPKTAGTTLNRLIEWEYRLSEMYSIDPVLFEWSAAHLRKLPPARLRKTRMFKGHMLFGLHEVLPQPSTYITVLRDPVERVLSAFYFMRSYKLHPLYWKLRREKWTMEEFVQRSTRDNVQCKIIAGADYDAPCTRSDIGEGKPPLESTLQRGRAFRALRGEPRFNEVAFRLEA